MKWLSPDAFAVSDHSSEVDFHILAAGDFCPRNEAEERIVQGRGRSLLEPMAEQLSGADAAIINVEGPVTTGGSPIPKSGPNLRLHPRSLEVLTAFGFNVAQLANNHIGDYGPDEVTATIQRLQDHGFHCVGAGANLQEARAPLVLTVQNCRIGLLSTAENEFGLAHHTRPGGNPLDPLAHVRQIRQLADQVDIALVLVHGGNEYNPVPSPRMQQTYRAFVEAGADAVIAGHPHCPQGVELYRGRPIIYSLGNFLFPKDQQYRPEEGWWNGFMVRLACGAGRIVKVELIPHRYMPDHVQTRPLGGKERDAFLGCIHELSDILQDEARVQQYWEAWCSRQGPQRLRTLQGAVWPLPDEQAYPHFLSARNVLSCEAHHEVALTFFELVRLGRLEEAEKKWPELHALQRIPQA